MPSKKHALHIHNAKENNLKGISTSIPHDEFTVITGLSGSGKSSLAFSTVYAEGQRRYIETFSPYTRQFFDKVKKPDVSSIENVRPAIAIQQRTRVTSSRSTVGSMTSINNYLSILWSNISKPVCPDCGKALTIWDADSLTANLQQSEIRERYTSFLVCSPIAVSNKRGALKTEVDRLTILGFSRFFNPTDNTIHHLDESVPVLSEENELIVVLDRIRSKGTKKKSLKESIEQAFNLSNKSCMVIALDESMAANISVFYNTYYCSTPTCDTSTLDIPVVRPSLFSFNSPLGACARCKGFGSILEVDPELCVPNPTLSIEDGAVQCWAVKSSRRHHNALLRFCSQKNIPITKPWKDLSETQYHEILNHRSRTYRGIIPWFKSREKKIYKMHVRVFLARYRSQFECPDCKGDRLKPQSCMFQLSSLSLPQICQMPVGELRDWLLTAREELSLAAELPRQLDDIFNSVVTRLTYLIDLGLPYLSLNRQARTLSGGETQRVNLTASLGSELVSTHFVLDEPSVGLHPRDTDRLIGAIRKLQTRGNSLLVVEHDLDCIRAANHVIELGPASGQFGGDLVSSGPQASWEEKGIQNAIPKTLLSVAGINKPVASDRCSSLLKIYNADERNLANINVEIPLNTFVCLTGVSGSGKSTLVTEVINKAWERRNKGLKHKGKKNIVEGFEHFQQILLVDQSPLAKSPRANIATYVKIWDTIRGLLSDTEDARVRALSKSAFSFNVEGGRCPECKGAGYIREDMQFLSDVYIPCEVCLGMRFQASVLEVTHEGRNVDDYLRMSVDECARSFHTNTSISNIADTLCTLGLGHLSLGHPLSELSGGEAQRLKLVPFIQRSIKGRSLLIFDEPTTGLHLRDVENLTTLFQSLRDIGHTVLCVEHNPNLILSSDWIIDLGPEGGKKGGEVVKTGKPKDFLNTTKSTNSYTAIYLQKYYADHEQGFANRKKGKNSSKVAKTTGLNIKGARVHNLKSIDIEVPFNKIVALTGVSGSGKSSIAKDIIYAEGQRRYLDCLSPYARQFIKELQRPDIDKITGVLPTICVYQHTFQPSRLSTIATMSEIYNHLRLLFAKTAVQHCPDHPEQSIAPLSAKDIAKKIQSHDHPSIKILAPIIKMKKGHHKAVFERAINSEILEVRVDGIFSSPAQYEKGLERAKVHNIDYTIAKFNPKRVDLEIVEDAVKQALGLGNGIVILNVDNKDKVYSQERACPTCNRGFFKPDPEDLSFNSRRGACKKCLGSGKADDDKLCSACGGARIAPIGRSLLLNAHNIHQLSLLSSKCLGQFLKDLPLDEYKKVVSEPILRELFSRLDTLTNLGLDYLPLDRDCSSLSAGELQRLRLATAMGSPLTGAMYIFDEPSAGLHPLDNARVLKRLKGLRDRRNSVILIEHDADSILSSDYVIDIGPGGGSHGGDIVFSGKVEHLSSAKNSITAKELNRKRDLKELSETKPDFSEFIEVKNCSKNNICGLSLKIPHNHLSAVIGVSGAGKSSLVHKIISDTLQHGEKKDFSWRSMAAWKKNSALITQFKERIILGMRQNGYSANFAANCVDQLKGFSEYGFPESHAASFALLVYASAWIKKYYPAIFAASLINSQPMGFYAPSQIISDAARHGVNIKEIDVNYSGWDCKTLREGDSWSLRLGMRLVKGLSATQVDIIIAAIDKFGRFSSIHALWSKTQLVSQTPLKKQSLYLLAKADAFRSMNLTRRKALWKIRALPKEILPLDRLMSDESKSLSFLKELPKQQSMFTDYSTTGLSLKGHPLQFIRHKLEAKNVSTAEALKKQNLKTGKLEVVTAGVVLFKQRPPSAKGVLFITLEDETGITNLILRPNVFEKYQKTILTNRYLLAHGSLERIGKVAYVLTDKIEALNVMDPTPFPHISPKSST